MDATVSCSGSSASRLEWPWRGWVLPVMLAFIVWRWWEIALRHASSTLGATHGATSTVLVPAAIFVIVRALGYLIEGAFYVTWWRTRGERLPYWRFIAWLMTLWLLDLLAGTLGEVARHHPAMAPLLAPFAGIGYFHPDRHPTAGLAAAFSTLGLLTLARLAGTAVLQARTLGRHLLQPLLLTTAAWLATRLLVGFGLDLARGVSPLP
jgi:hypothetical protein